MCFIYTLQNYLLSNSRKATSAAATVTGSCNHGSTALFWVPELYSGQALQPHIYLCPEPTGLALFTQWTVQAYVSLNSGYSYGLYFRLTLGIFLLIVPSLRCLPCWNPVGTCFCPAARWSAILGLPLMFYSLCRVCRFSSEKYNWVKGTLSLV